MLLRIIVFFVNLSVLANAQCFAKCLAGSCDKPISHAERDSEEHSSCHHGKEPSPSEQQTHCPYQQLLVDGSPRPGYATPIHIDTPALVAVDCDTHFGVVSKPAVLPLPSPSPPLISDLIASTILRL